MKFEELLQAAKRGEKEAKEELFLMYRPMILRESMVDGKFSEDLYQELSKTFLVCLERFNPDWNQS